MEKRIFVFLFVLLLAFGKANAQCSFTLDEKEFPAIPTYYQNQEYWFNLTVNHAESESNISTVFFSWNNGENQTISNYVIINSTAREYYLRLKDLAAGNYNFKWYINDSQNCWEVLEKTYIISKNFSSISVSFFPSNYTVYGNAKVFCNINQGDALAYLELYRNEILVKSGYGNLSFDESNLEVGTYNYTCIYNESQNYTFSISTNNILTIWHPCNKNHPPLTGNWNVNSLTECFCPNKEEIIVNGNAYITSTFTLQNCILKVRDRFYSQTNAVVNISNSILNSTTTGDKFYFRGNSVNFIQNSIFVKNAHFNETSKNFISNTNFSSTYFYGNSINRIENSNFTSVVNISENSINEINNSVFYFSLNLKDRSNSSIYFSKIFILSIYSGLSHNLTISDLYPSQNLQRYYKAEGSNFTINLGNVNVSIIRFYALGSSNNTIINSVLGFSSFYGNSKNKIENSTFNDTSGIDEKVRFYDFSYNKILNSTFANESSFYGNSKNEIERSYFIGSRTRFYDYSITNISYSNITHFQIGSTVPHTLLITDLAAENLITKFIKASSSFTINLIDVNVSYLRFWASDSSKNNLINFTSNGDSYFEGNSINVINNSRFNASSYFYANSINLFINSTLSNVWLGVDWSTPARPKINFTNSQVTYWKVSTTSSNSIIRGRLDNVGSVGSWGLNGNVTRYYPIRVLYLDGRTAQGINVSITSSPELVWTGCTNQQGYAVDPLGIDEPYIFFNYSNRMDNFNISVNDSLHWNTSTQINFLTDTIEDILVYLEGEPVTPYKHHGYLGINYTPLTLGTILPVNVYVINEGISEDDYRIDVFYPNQAYAEVYSKIITNVKPNSIKKGQIGIKILREIPKSSPINITVRITCLRCPCPAIDEKNITVYGNSPALKEIDLKEIILLILISSVFYFFLLIRIA